MIHCFEPAPECWLSLRTLADDRTKVHQFGLWSSDAELSLFDAGEIGASVFAEKAISQRPTRVEVKDVGAWLAHNVAEEDEVVMKLNCEGAECEVIDRIHATGQLRLITELLIHFDVRKIAGLEHREATTRALLAEEGVKYQTADKLFFGRNTQEKTANWLGWYHAKPYRKLYFSVWKRIEFGVRTRASIELRN